VGRWATLRRLGGRRGTGTTPRLLLPPAICRRLPALPLPSRQSAQSAGSPRLPNPQLPHFCRRRFQLSLPPSSAASRPPVAHGFGACGVRGGPFGGWQAKLPMFSALLLPLCLPPQQQRRSFNQRLDGLHRLLLLGHRPGHPPACPAPPAPANSPRLLNLCWNGVCCCLKRVRKGKGKGRVQK
jgi:hypothetical protein